MAKLGLKIVINNEEKDLDDIFLKITDYNTNISEYQDGEAVVLTQNTGIKYIDENGVKKDLIERYIGYDSEGYIETNYEPDPSRVDVSSLNAIKDINGNNLVNLFYQLGTKKVSSNGYKSYQIHNKTMVVNFKMRFIQDVIITIEANHSNDIIIMKYNGSNIININKSSVSIDRSLSVIDIKEDTTIKLNSGRLKFYIRTVAYLNIGSGTATYTFDKDTV